MGTHESYVSLEPAKLLKKAGFDWGCDTFYGLDVRHNGESIDFDEECELKAEGNESEIEYVDGGTIYNFYHSNKKGEDFGGYSRPTLAVAQRWLREVKNMSIEIYSTKNFASQNWYHYKIVDKLGMEITSRDCDLYTYEEALEAGIKKCLTLLLKNTKK